MSRRTGLLLSVIIAALVGTSGVAFAVNQVCPSGTSFPNPCKGTPKTKKTTGNDLLIGTSGQDFIFALSGNDKISAGPGNDYTDGGAGNDTYSYTDGWGTDMVVDSSGVDTLNFSAVSGNTTANLVPEFGQNTVSGPGGSVNVSLSSGSVIEKYVGSASGLDFAITGGAANTLQPGPGTGGGTFWDYGGNGSIPVSNDTYSGLLANGYGSLFIRDYGGTADKLILPFASTDAYFEASDSDGDRSPDTLLILSTSTDHVWLDGQLEPFQGVPGHIETIQFTDGNLSIGSASATSVSSATSSSDSGASQVDALNAASTLSASKKDELAKAATKILSEVPPSSPTSLDNIKAPKK